MNTFVVTGLMSGSSLDGLDIAQVLFNQQIDQWDFRLLACETIPFPAYIRDRLSQAHVLPSNELYELDSFFGQWCGNQALQLEKRSGVESLCIASHGHTVFHQPQKGFSVQIGHGAALAVAAQKPVICDFRNTDIAYGGQGAPLVPYGEKLLFPSVDAFLNLGGIANITLRRERGELQAWDILGFNQVLNYLSKDLPNGFDKNGERAKSGNILLEWMSKWENWDFLLKQPPKSLSNEEIRTSILNFLPEGMNADLSCTYCHFSAVTLAREINRHFIKSLMITGGGTYHEYFMTLFKKELNNEIRVIIPNRELIDNKEAIIFAFLGLLRWLGIPNILNEVTGSSKNSSGGCIYIP